MREGRAPTMYKIQRVQQTIMFSTLLASFMKVINKHTYVLPKYLLDRAKISTGPTSPDQK